KRPKRKKKKVFGRQDPLSPIGLPHCSVPFFCLFFPCIPCIPWLPSSIASRKFSSLIRRSMGLIHLGAACEHPSTPVGRVRLLPFDHRADLRRLLFTPLQVGPDLFLMAKVVGNRGVDVGEVQ